MFQQLEKRIEQSFAAHILIRYGLEIPVLLEEPKQSSFGEFAVPTAFQLARQLKKAPRAIAQELVDEIPPIEGVAAMEVAGNGYINLRLDRAAYFTAITSPQPGGASASKSGKVIVEHTNINPNKAAHIGHLRNAVLGDTFVRMLRATGSNVEVQNYIDNTGVQVADVVVAFHFLEKKSVAEVRELIDNPQRPFDYVCWDLYAHISGYYKDNPDSLQWRSETLHAVEAGHGEIAEMGHLVADAIVSCHIRTMLRLGIVYDVLPRESEILHLKFWATAFEQLKERKAIYLETEGKNKGCWVMPGSAFKANRGAGAPPKDPGAESPAPALFAASATEVAGEEDGDDSKVIVRSNGTVTYVGKDIAYQMWKFGLLGKDFHYRKLLTYENGHELWVSTAEPVPGEKSFGAGERVYNVIDSRQSYLQDVVVAGLRALGYNGQAERSIHFSYEMVALSPRTCVELGIELSEEDKKRPYVEVSGRKGLGVKADDLIDKLADNAFAVASASRNAGAPEADRRRVASQIAVAALRYFMLKYTRNTVIAFDFQEALSFTGESGPYVQYAAVRATNILRNVESQLAIKGSTAMPVPGAGSQLKASEDLWQWILTASKMESAIARAVTAGEPAHAARYAFQVAQAFANFYDNYRVLEEKDESKRTLLIWITAFFRQQLQCTLDVLGIDIPDFM